MTTIKIDQAKRQKAIHSHLLILEFTDSGNLVRHYIEAIPDGIAFSNRQERLMAMVRDWASRRKIATLGGKITVKPFEIEEHETKLTTDQDAIKAFVDDTSQVEPDDWADYMTERENWLDGDSAILSINGYNFLLDEDGYIVGI